MDQPLEVHRLAAGEGVVAWWRAGVPFAQRDRYVQWYGRLVLTTARLLFEPDRVGDDAHPDGPTFRPTEVAYEVPLKAIDAIDPMPGDRPPRVRFTLVDGRELMFVVTRQSGVVTQWTRDTGERDRSVDVVRRVLREVDAHPSAATGAPVAGSSVPLVPLVPAALAARAEDHKARGRRSARRVLVGIVAVTGVLVAAFLVLQRSSDAYEDCPRPQGAAFDDLGVLDGECTQAEAVASLWAATDECRPVDEMGGSCALGDVRCETSVPRPTGDGTGSGDPEVRCRSASDGFAVRFSPPTP